MAFTIENGILKEYIPEDGETEIVIPEGVTSIGDSAFEYCTGLTSVTIPEGVTSIGRWTFYRCTSLTSVTIPASVTNIGGSAFSGTPWLENYPGDLVIINGILLNYKGTDAHVTIPEGVTAIGERAFYSCKRLVSMTIPEGVTSIGDSAFEYCTGLTSVTIPEGVTSIGESAFRWCKVPASMTIPESVTSIGLFAFGGTPWLNHYPDDMVVVNGILLKYKGKDTAAVIPEGVTSIADGAFRGCIGLTSVIIPEGVTSIGDRAFEDCSSLTSVTMYGITFASKKLKDNDFFDAMEMLRTKYFSMKLNTDIKYSAAVGFWMKTGDETAGKFIKKSISRIMAFLIRNNNVEAIWKLLESGKFLTKRNIDKFITCAIEHTWNGGSLEIQTMLMHHKAEVLGYKDPAAHFKL